MKTILIATDFCENANQAADYADKFARQLRSNVKLIHAASLNADSSLQVIWPIEDHQTRINRNSELLESFPKSYIMNLLFHATVRGISLKLILAPHRGLTMISSGKLFR